MDPKLDDKIFHRFINSPIGQLIFEHDGSHLLSLQFSDKEVPKNSPYEKNMSFGNLIEHQLKLYFEGTLQKFEIPLKQAGTSFQQSVWEYLTEIPYGHVISYLNLAIKTGSKNNHRAVASANGANKIMIIVPCHRVIGKDGSMTGYAGGIERKKWLLQHEIKHNPESYGLF